MSFSIKEEANRNRLMPFSQDKMGDRYVTASGIYTFPSPSSYTLEKNLFYLLKNSTRKIFDVKYAFRPDYLSYDEYETTVLAQLLMYVNGVLSLEDFDLGEVTIPDFSAIVFILQDNFPEKKVERMEVIDW